MISPEAAVELSEGAEERVARYLRSLDLEVRRIPRGQEKTPDFSVSRTGELLLFCEVKSKNDVLGDRLKQAQKAVAFKERDHISSPGRLSAEGGGATPRREPEP